LRGVLLPGIPDGGLHHGSVIASCLTPLNNSRGIALS